MGSRCGPIAYMAFDGEKDDNSPRGARQINHCINFTCQLIDITEYA